MISKKLVTLRNDLDLPVSIKQLDFKPLKVEKLLKFLDEMEFNRIKSLVVSRFGLSDNINENKKIITEDGKYFIPERNKINRDIYELISNKNELTKWISKVYKTGVVAIDCETTSLNAVEAKIVGFSMSLENSNACYIPLNHSNFETQIDLKDFIKQIKTLLEDDSVLKLGQNIKYDFIVLKRLGIEMENMDDTMLMSYVLRTGQRGHGLDELSSDYLSHETIKYSDVTTVNKKKVPFSEIPVNQAKDYAAEDADITYRLWEILKVLLIKNSLYDFYFYIERPLINVIADMEISGCKIDNVKLTKLSKEFSEKMMSIEDEIFKLCEGEFNLGSPKQLGEILFDKLKLPHGKKGKSGNYQTDVKVLEKLKMENFKIASLVLNWRQFSKLKSTYCEGLLSRENHETKRIHTSFGMASTLTGRLSSNDPNLQNIPIKTPEGREIRKVFVSEEKKRILSIDYSQIELRILAHVADIETLINAFENDSDIHTITAIEVFQLSRDKVTQELRRKAKIINFGIIYGISPYGLALQLEISNNEAKMYMEKYFKKYPGIRDYMRNTIENCRSNGYVKTPFGRRIFIPYINDKTAMRRNFAERSAINAPIQGGAADMIKLAMPRVHKFLLEEKLQTKILLQVHDELLFESPQGEIKIIQDMIPHIMTTSHEKFISLNVPIKVDSGIGASWDDAH